MIGNLLTDGLDSTVEAIEIQSAWGPPIYIRDPFRKAPRPGAGSGAGSSGRGIDLARIMKPKVVVHMRDGIAPAVFAPYGEPGPSRWPWLAVGGASVLAFLLYEVFVGCPRRGRRK